MKVKTGIGYDIHQLVEGRPLMIGGVKIKHNKGLDGHSDADVLLHAVCDALLGAIGQGDIGEHFPNTDAEYKNISSLVLLEKVRDLVYNAGYTIGNIDAVLQIEKPKIRDYKPQMKGMMAKALHIEESDINIKATTQEQLGSLGRGEGIAAFATTLIWKE